MLQTQVTIVNQSCETLDLTGQRFNVRIQGYATWSGLMPTIVKEANISAFRSRYPFLIITEGSTFEDGQTPILPGKIPYAEKGAPGGVATLDETGKIAVSQYDSADVLLTSQKGVANGVASLNASGKLASNQIPDIQIIMENGSTVTLTCT